MREKYLGIDDNGSTLYTLKRQASNYIETDSNASLIKQGMMLEYILKDYLEKTGQLECILKDSVRKSRSKKTKDITLNAMLQYMCRENIVPKGSDTDFLCDKVRTNRNKAVHEFLYDSNVASQTLPPLINFCRGLQKTN